MFIRSQNLYDINILETNSSSDKLRQQSMISSPRKERKKFVTKGPQTTLQKPIYKNIRKKPTPQSELTLSPIQAIDHRSITSSFTYSNNKIKQKRRKERKRLFKTLIYKSATTPSYKGIRARRDNFGRGVRIDGVAL
jgi:hypothetical protein